MKKIDIRKTMDERVRDTEWTDENTWTVLRMIRRAKADRREFSLRKLMPAAVALVLLLGFGVTALIRSPGRPDPVLNNTQYTAQPIVTAMSPGHGEDTGDLPEGSMEKKVIEALRESCPEAADLLMPVNRVCEKDGVRLEIISGLVKENESWILYSLQDLEGKNPGTALWTELWSSSIGDPDEGQELTLYQDEEEHKVYLCSYTHYSEPVSTEARMIAMGVNYYEARRIVNLDALQLLKDLGVTSEGVLSPELIAGTAMDGTPIPKEKVKVLDYTQPMNIPVVGNVLLTGIGWVDGQFHVQFHNPDTRTVIGENVTVSGDWSAYMDFNDDYWKDGLYDSVIWDENGDGSVDWKEFIVDCDPEYLEKLKPQIEVSTLENLVNGSWEVDLPLNLVCAESEPVEVEMKRSPLDDDTEYNIRQFFRDWVGGDADRMWQDVAYDWRMSREDGDGSLRSLIASGTPLSFQVNAVFGSAAAEEQTVTLTVEMKVPGTETPVCRRYQIPVRSGDFGRLVDPTGFSDWEDGEFDPFCETILLDDETNLNRALTEGYGYASSRLNPVNLSSAEKQGIRLDVLSGFVSDQRIQFLCSVEDTEGAYAEFPSDPVFTGDFGAKAEVSPVALYRSTDGHYAVYMVYVDFSEPVSLEDRTVTLTLNSVNVREGFQTDLMPLLKEHAKAVEGIELPDLAQRILQHRDRGATGVPGLKILDYTQPLNIALFQDTYLTGAGWIDGKLHVQLCNTGRSSQSLRQMWINTLLGGKMDILRKEADYSPLDWYDDTAYWYEYIFDYTQEDLDQLEMTANRLAWDTTLKDDWTVSFPLSTILTESEPETAEPAELFPEQVIREAINESYPGVGNELITIGQSVEKKGIRVNLISGQVKGNESRMVYALQDPENKYSGLEIEPVDFYNTVCPEDSESNGLLSIDTTDTTTADLTIDENARRTIHLIMCTHSEPAQDPDRKITLGLRDLKFVRHTTENLLPYIQEYAKPEEGKVNGGNRKFPDTADQLSIPLGREDVLLTGIGWIDNQLHMRVEYTGEATFMKNGTSYGQACIAWITGIGTDPVEQPDWSVTYTTPTEAGSSASSPRQFEYILDFGEPENLDKLELFMNIDVIEDALQGDWTFSFPLSTIYTESEPETAEP